MRFASNNAYALHNAGAFHLRLASEAKRAGGDGREANGRGGARRGTEERGAGQNSRLWKEEVVKASRTCEQRRNVMESKSG